MCVETVPSSSVLKREEGGWRERRGVAIGAFCSWKDTVLG
jgi:hypothetical protein